MGTVAETEAILEGVHDVLTSKVGPCALADFLVDLRYTPPMERKMALEIGAFVMSALRVAAERNRRSGQLQEQVRAEVAAGLQDC